MRAWLALAGAATAVAVLAPSASAGEDDGNSVIGRAIFVRDNCASCHGQFGQGGMGPNLRNESPNDDEIRNAVRNGRPTRLPSFRGLLGDRDLANLTESIDSMRDDDEPVFSNWWDSIPSRFRASPLLRPAGTASAAWASNAVGRALSLDAIPRVLA